MCHDAAGRTERVADYYQRFTHAARKTHGLRKLLGKAHQRLAEIHAGTAQARRPVSPS